MHTRALDNYASRFAIEPLDDAATVPMPLADLDAAGDPQQHFGRRDLLGDELARLLRLTEFAGRHPRRWQACIAGREGALALWLFGVALGLAAQDMADAALALLDVLPGVAAGAGGRRALLQALIAEAALEQAPDARPAHGQAADMQTEMPHLAA